ncbi:UNC93-like protein MFSD11 [Vespa velutina]|uniref:UNC93-like protein MFSD11 n=1 Tax=Vespa velutina TaxID=202808 RepID=UPI001FB481AA|nr:UNC93-like protein MFSD11 [Vespa velutina]
MAIDKSFINVVVLSFGFMMVFAAFQTMSNIENTVLTSIHNEDTNFNANAYTSLAILYAVFATCNWLAPSYILLTGPRIAIVTGCCCYVLFIASFLWPHPAFLYTASAILGVGAAFIWTGHGQYLTENSDNETMSRNAGIFWAIFQSSLFIGNLFVYFMFNSEHIEKSVRRTVFIVLIGLALFGTIILAVLRKPSQRLALGEAEGVSSADKELHIPEPAKEKPLLAAWYALRDAFSLFLTPKMLFLSFTFIYTGLQLTFFSAVYASSIGFTKAMGESRKRLIGLSGIFVGIGEVVGGTLFGIFASKVSEACGGSPVVIIGCFTHLFAFISIYLNLPNSASFIDTDEKSFIEPSSVLAMAGSLALGFGDACFNTQVYSLLGILFAVESASAFALFKFCQSVAAAVSFAYSSKTGLHVQLLILVISIIIGTTTFVSVERKMRNSQSQNQPDIDPALVEGQSIAD